MFKQWFVRRLVGTALLALLTHAHAEVEREWPEAGLEITTELAVRHAADKRVIVPAWRYESIRPKGPAAMVSRQGRYGLINTNGQAVTPLIYSEMSHIWRRGAHAWFAVTIETPNGQLRGGIIDETGRTLVEPVWDAITMLSPSDEEDEPSGAPPTQAVFRVRRDNLYGAVNLTGRITIRPQFTAVISLGQGDTMVLLRKGDQTALCDAATGDCPIALGAQPLKELDPDAEEDKLLVVGAPGKLGLLDRRGRIVLPLVHDDIGLVRPDPGAPPPLAVRQGLRRQWLALQHAPDGRWQALPTKPPRALPSYYDEHAQARQDRPLIDARYLPVALHTADQISAALQDGRMQAPLLPSIQLSDRRAYVQFAALLGQPQAQAWPSVMIRCALPGGFRLLPIQPEADTDLQLACDKHPLDGLRFQRRPDEQMTCVNCVESGLPEQWLREDPPHANECHAGAPNWDERAASKKYASWVKDWAKLWRPVLRGDPLSNDDRWAALVAPQSRAFYTLVQLRQDEESVVRSLGVTVKGPPKATLVRHFVDWMLKARPVRFGGIYPESDARMAGLCAEIWYVQLPGVEARLASPGMRTPLPEPYVLPPEGTLQRGAYPFLTFQQDPKGLQLAGISREFLQMIWWLEGGQ